MFKTHFKWILLRKPMLYIVLQILYSKYSPHVVGMKVRTQLGPLSATLPKTCSFYMWIYIHIQNQEYESALKFTLNLGAFDKFYGCSFAACCWWSTVFLLQSHTSLCNPFQWVSLSILWAVTEAFNIHCLLKQIWIKEKVNLYFTDRSESKQSSFLNYICINWAFR